MRQLERRLSRLEAGRGAPLPVLDDEILDADERDGLRRSFGRMMLDYGERRPAGEIDLAGFRAEAAEQDARLRELLGGREDTPELAAADDETVRRWEASVPQEQRDAALRRRWPERPSFAFLAAEYETLRQAGVAEPAEPAEAGAAAAPAPTAEGSAA